MSNKPRGVSGDARENVFVPVVRKGRLQVTL
jgi:hypothetical protein